MGKVFKVGCLFFVIMSAIGGMIAFWVAPSAPQSREVRRSAPAPVVAREKPEVKPAVPEPVADPVVERYGMSAKSLRIQAYNLGKKIVSKYCFNPPLQLFPIEAVESDTKFFEFERYNTETKKMDGPFAGVNIKSSVTIKHPGKDRVEIPWSGTLHYNVAEKNWTVKTFYVNGEQVEGDK